MASLHLAAKNLFTAASLAVTTGWTLPEASGQCPLPASCPAPPNPACPPALCGTLTCSSGICDVYCYDQLRAALNCLANSGQCRHIRIPSNVCIDVCKIGLDPIIALNSTHSRTAQARTHIEINGTIRFVGIPQDPEKVFDINGCDYLTIDGCGLITSIYDPPTVNAAHAVATTFKIGGNADYVTIANLNVTNMTDVVKVEGPASHLTILNVHGQNLGDYGIFLNHERIDADIENCSMISMEDEHPFRLYGNDIEVRNCWSYDSNKTGFWRVDGIGCNVDRFSTDKWIRVGPNPQAANSLASTHIRMRELHGLDEITVPDTNPSIVVEMGVDRLCMVNCCIKHLRVGSSGSAAHNRPLQNFNWDHLDHPDPGETVFVEEYPLNPQIGPNVNQVPAPGYQYCFADIDRNHAVDIDDLLAVISGWGDCAAPPVGILGPPPPCAADIAPTICGDNTVNIDDLLYVISNWGGCPENPECGLFDPVEAGEPEEPPETIDDCWQKCSQAYPGGGQPWADCFEGCLEALEEMQSGGGP